MVGTVQFDAKVIQRIKDLLLEDKGSIVIEQILKKEVTDPKSPIYQMDIPTYGGIERSIKPKLKTRDFVKGVPGFSKEELKTLEERGKLTTQKVTEQDYLDIQKQIKKNPNLTRVDVANKLGVADTYIYTIEDTYSGKHGKLNYKVMSGKAAPQLPYVTENAKKILKAMEENPTLTTGTKIRDHPDVNLTVKQFNSAIAALKNNKVNPETNKLRFDISDDLAKKIKRIKGGTITTVEENLVKNKILDKQQVKDIFTRPRIAVREFFDKGTVFEHAFPRTLINKKINGKNLFDAETRAGLELTGSRTSPYLNFTKVKIDNLQRGLVNAFLADEITLDEYRKGIDKLKTQFKKVTGGYEIGYIDFDKNKNPTPITNIKKATLSAGEFGPGTVQKTTPFENAKYTSTLLKNYLKNPDDDIFSSLRRQMPNLEITPSLISQYDESAKAFTQVKPYLNNTKKFMVFAENNLDNPLVKSLIQAPEGGINKTPEQLTKRFGKIKSQLQTAANLNDNNICSIFGLARGGLAGGGCGNQMRQALNEMPDETITRVAEQGPNKFKALATGFLNIAKKGGKFGALAAVGAAGAGAVKTFMNDDPTTYLSNENQQKNMLIDMVTGQLDDTPVEEAPIGDAYLPTLGAVTVAGTAAVAPSTIDAARSGALGAKKSGITKTALKTLGRGLTVTTTPLGLLATEPLYLAEQIQEGDSLGEIATNPFNYLGPAFAGPATEFATKGLKSPGIAKAMRLGISPGALRVASRAFGLPGLALSLGISGYEMYDDYKNKRGIFSEE
jgi:hypothetical protein